MSIPTSPPCPWKTRNNNADLWLQVYKIIEEAQERGPVNFFKLVINPDDFGQTVENVFYASFLIKDGTAGIHVDENGLIIIRKLSIHVDIGVAIELICQELPPETSSTRTRTQSRVKQSLSSIWTHGV